MGNIITQLACQLWQIEQGRGLGNTTALIKAVKSNPKAVLVVASYSRVEDITFNFPDIAGRVVSIHNASRFIGRNDVFPIYDNSAIQSLLSNALAAIDRKHNLLDKTDSLLDKVKDLLKEINNELNK